MTLTVKAIERLFERLQHTYGAAWDRSLGNVPVEKLPRVKELWADELGGFANNLQALAWALENLPETPPNVIQFRNLARRAPAPEVLRLPEPKADPEKVAKELAKLEPIRQAAKDRAANRCDWARQILGRYEAGERVLPYTLNCAREALSRGSEGT